jgi:Clp amino terminal domain, pathogenicity island component
MGRSEAFAAAAGSSRVEPEHVLLGLLWDPQSVQTGMLRDVGTSRTAVLDALVRFEVYVPPVELPPEDMRPWGKRVWVPAGQFGLVLRNVMARLPEGTRFGFNSTADGRYWMQAGAEVDLQAIVDEILA